MPSLSPLLIPLSPLVCVRPSVAGSLRVHKMATETLCGFAVKRRETSILPSIYEGRRYLLSIKRQREKCACKCESVHCSRERWAIGLDISVSLFFCHMLAIINSKIKKNCFPEYAMWFIMKLCIRRNNQQDLIANERLEDSQYTLSTPSVLFAIWNSSVQSSVFETIYHIAYVIDAHALSFIRFFISVKFNFVFQCSKIFTLLCICEFTFYLFFKPRWQMGFEKHDFSCFKVTVRNISL